MVNLLERGPSQPDHLHTYTNGDDDDQQVDDDGDDNDYDDIDDDTPLQTLNLFP